VATVKGPDAFRTISEAAAELGVPQHVLRFWETKFSFIRPGVQRLHKEHGIAHVVGAASASNGSTPIPTLEFNAFETPDERQLVLNEDTRAHLQSVLEDLESVKARIDKLLG
jgi:hypothetical protein